MAEFSIDLDALLTAVDRMSQFEGQLELSLAQVKASVETLRPAWQGDAAEAQQRAQEQWNSGADQMRGAFERLRGITEQAHANYSGAAAMNMRMWG